MNILNTIKTNDKLKEWVLWAIKNDKRARPRWYVRFFINPFLIRRGQGSVYGRGIRLDILPFHPFSIGEDSILEDYTIVNNGMGSVSIGNRTLIGLSNVLIGPLEIGHNVILAQHVVLSGMNHGYLDPETPIRDQKCTALKIQIEDDAWIGANSVITAGVSIGKHAIIGGGSVVTKDVPSYSIAAGNPARVIKKFNFNTQTWDKV